MIQGTPEWKAHRAQFIGASDAPVIMGVCKFKLNDGRPKTPHILWQEKLGLLDGETDNANTRHGKAMENPARLVYQEMSGYLVEPDMAYHASIPFMMASLDGITDDKTRAVEIKNCNAEDHELAKKGKIPVHYYPQIQHQLACLGHKVMDYFSYHKGEGIIVSVMRDDKYIEEMIEKEKEFWSFVETLREPPLTELDYQEMDDAWEEMAEELYSLEERIKRQQQKAKEMKEEMKRLSDFKPSKKGDYMLVSSRKPGNIDYTLIPELQEVNLECYRKSEIVAWTLKKVKK